MPCRASASRCRSQVTSNVRHPRTNVQMQFGTRAPGKLLRRGCLAERHRRRENSATQQSRVLRTRSESKPKTAQSAARLPWFGPRFASSCFASPESMLQPIGWSSRSRWQGAHRAEIHGYRGDKESRATGLPASRSSANRGTIQNMGAALVHLAGLPNPSVNLTRNSVPRWPSEARYAHNAPLVQQVTLSHAGYLKR
jgi:hypothetical protein